MLAKVGFVPKSRRWLNAQKRTYQFASISHNADFLLGCSIMSYGACYLLKRA